MDEFFNFLTALGNSVVQCFKSVRLTLFGITFDFFEIFIWSFVLFALIWFIKKLLE